MMKNFHSGGESSSRGPFYSKHTDTKRHTRFCEVAEKSIKLRISKQGEAKGSLGRCGDEDLNPARRITTRGDSSDTQIQMSSNT